MAGVSPAAFRKQIGIVYSFARGQHLSTIEIPGHMKNVVPASLLVPQKIRLLKIRAHMKRFRAQPNLLVGRGAAVRKVPVRE
jgi:hypothetical protein